MLKKYGLLLLWYVLFEMSFQPGFAQSRSTTLKGTVVNKDGKPVDGCTVLLFSKNAVIPAKTAITDSAGGFLFTIGIVGDLSVRCSHVLYGEAVTAFQSTSNELVDIGIIRLQPLEATLNNVTVTGKRPLVQKLDDKIVVNVENSIVSAGGTALEVLSRSPGVSIQGDLLAMRGKNTVLVLIDGKQTGLSGQQLTSYLASLPAQSIDRIELIANPDAKYDASGSAGVIDIKLKKDLRFGLNGTINGSVGGGINTRYNAGFALNSRTRKVNFSFSINLSGAKPINHYYATKSFYYNGIDTGGYRQNNDINRRNLITNSRIGLDLVLSKKSNLGLNLTGNMVLQDRLGSNASTEYNGNKTVVGSFTSLADGVENSGNITGNINYRTKLDTAGNELRVDLDAARFITDWHSTFVTTYRDKNGAVINPVYLTSSEQDGYSTIRSVKMDYINGSKNHLKLEGGIKITELATKSKVFLFNNTASTPVLDSSKSNDIKYRELIKAVYVSLKQKSANSLLQLGLRMEQVNMRRDELLVPARTDSSYLKLFPFVSYQYNITPIKSVSIQYARRIDRPTFGQLNPFKIVVDPSLLTSGSPILKPQISDNIEFSYRYKNHSFTLNYSNTEHLIYNILRPIPNVNKAVLQIPVNIQRNTNIGMGYLTSVKLAGWWNMVASGNIFYNHYTGMVDGNRINTSNINGLFNINHSMSFKKGYSGELGVNYNSGSDIGIAAFKSQTVLNIGVQKVLSPKATIRINAADLLWRQWPRAVNKLINLNDVWYAERDTRIVTLAFTYRFGNNKVTSTAAPNHIEEDRKRVAQ